MKYAYIYDFCYNGLLLLMFLISLLIIETNAKQFKNNPLSNNLNENTENNNQFTISNQIFINKGKELIQNQNQKQKSNGNVLPMKNIISSETNFNNFNFIEITNNEGLQQIPPTYSPNRYTLPNFLISNDQINASKLIFLNQYKKESPIENLGINNINNDLLNSAIFIDSLSRGALISSRYKVDSFPQIDINNLSKNIKNIECVIKQGYLFYLKPRTPAHLYFIDLGFSQKYCQIIEVMIILNSSYFQVLLNGTTDILKLGLSDIQAVKKSNSNNKCLNIFDNLNQIHKFCQIDNLLYNSSDNWVDEIIKFKSYCIFAGYKEPSQLENPSANLLGSIFKVNPFATNRYAKSIFDYNKSKINPENDNNQDLSYSHISKKKENTHQNIKNKNHIKQKNNLKNDSMNGKSIGHFDRIIDEEIETNNNENLNTNSINVNKNKYRNSNHTPNNLTSIDKKNISIKTNSSQEFINENKEIEVKNFIDVENGYDNDNNRNIDYKTINTKKILNYTRDYNQDKTGNIQINNEENKIKDVNYNKMLNKNNKDGDDDEISENQALNQIPLKKFKIISKKRIESNSMINSNITSVVDVKINNCFSKDPDIMIDFFKNLKNNNSQYSNFYLSSISYCYLCCKTKLNFIQKTEMKCCHERCDINSNNSLLISLTCIKTHSENLIKKNFLPEENFGNLPGTKESLLIGTYKKTKENYSKISRCFTKDIMKIQMYTLDIFEKKKGLTPSEINKDNFCMACCKVEFDKDPRGKRCCEERCEIQQNKIKKVSIFCIIPHLNMLKFENYIN